MPERISGENFSREVLDSQIPVIADFYSDSCVPCKRISPILSKLESEYAGRLKVVKINANFEEELVSKYNISVTPTILFFNKGEETDRLKGAVTREDITAITDRLI